MARWARICRIVTIVYWCTLFAATHVPGRMLPHVPVSDKIQHLTCYGGLAFLLFLSFFLGGRRRPADIAVLVLGVMICYGAIDEWTQIPVGRDCELADWYADCAGSSVAVVAMTIAVRRIDR